MEPRSQLSGEEKTQSLNGQGKPWLWARGQNGSFAWVANEKEKERSLFCGLGGAGGWGPLHFRPHHVLRNYNSQEREQTSQREPP